MIIKAIHATNLLKYETLDIENIPESGIIGVSGQNEAGKSSIGEVICFALFGRTYSLHADDVQKVIRWGESQTTIRLVFQASDTLYELTRMLDSDGNRSAKVTLLNDPDTILVKGVEGIGEFIYETIGYDFDEFIESFYLAQREITTPNPNSYVVKAMAGVTSIEYVIDELTEEAAVDRDSIDVRYQEIFPIEADIEELALEPSMLELFQNDESKLREAIQSTESQIEQVDIATSNYQQLARKLSSVKANLGFARWSGFFLLLLSLIAGVSWYLLNEMPSHQYAQQLSEILGHSVPFWQSEKTEILLYAAAWLFGGFVLFVLAARHYKQQARKIIDAGESLANHYDALHCNTQDEIVLACEYSDANVAVESEDDVINDNASILEPPENDEGHADFVASLRSCRANGRRVWEKISLQCSDARHMVDKWSELLRYVEQTLSIEQERIALHNKLNLSLQTHQDAVSNLQHNIDERMLAVDLLRQASHEFTRRFNKHVRELVANTLPLFTDGRYEHLQIEEDLSVRVFSSVKKDFLDLEEISSGTQRQIMLALRLALSQELVNRVVEGPQFIFLDEPFAFFDQERTRGAMKALPELSDDFRQVWIVAQEFPAGTEEDFSGHINCQRDNMVLTISANS